MQENWALKTVQKNNRFLSLNSAHSKRGRANLRGVTYQKKCLTYLSKSQGWLNAP